MSRAGHVWDNPAIKCFSPSLKIELMAPTRADAKDDVFDYIERFYNLKQRFSRLGNLSQMEFEMNLG